jgi:hypothetical protein
VSARFLFIFVLGCAAFTANAQPASQHALQDIIEKYIENTDANADYTELLDQLNLRLNNPLHLNRASREEFLSLILLTENQVNNLIRHRETTGNFIAVYELQSIEGFDIPLIFKLLPFITLDNKFTDEQTSMREMFKQGRNEIILTGIRDIERRKGYIIADTLTDPAVNHYAGSPLKLSLRYRFTYTNRLSIGINAEKDPGEQFFNGAQQNGFDFYSAHYFVRNPGLIKTFAAGDFQAAFGQGLTFGSGLAFSKSSAVMNIRRNREGLNPYRSMNEAGFLRGLGTTLAIGRFNITGFFSLKKADGNFSGGDTLTESFSTVTSIIIGGLHRTPNEIAKQNTITQQVSGLNITYSQSSFSMGVTAVNYRFSNSLQKEDNVYSRFQFSGNSLTNIGISYGYLWRNMNFFGETTVSNFKGGATVNGVLISLDPKVDFSMLYRNYSKDFHTFSSTSFSESVSRNNEKGLYTGITIRPYRKWTLLAYFDTYRFPWLKFRADAPSSGFDYLIEAQFSPSKAVQMYWRLREERKQVNAPGQILPIDFLTEYSRKTFRFHISYRISDALVLKSRAELSAYSDGFSEKQTGMLMFQDISYHPLSSKLDLTARMLFFDTDGFNSRLYAYETDLPYSFSIPAFQGKGTRFYLLLSYKVLRNLDAGIRYARTIYENESSISSGLDEIRGNVKSDVRTQLRWNF